MTMKCWYNFGGDTGSCPPDWRWLYLDVPTSASGLPE